MKKMMKRGLAVVLGLSLCVSMMIPVFAEDAKVVTCGEQAHTHTSACYVEGAEPACGLSETEVRESTETVVDEETGETKEVKTYEVVPVHTHGTDCYEAELVCGLKEHTHDDGCYGRDANVGEDGSVTPPETFEATADGTKAEVTVGEDGKATVIVNGQKVEAEVKTEVTSKPVNTTTGGAGETIKGETTNVYDEEGNLIGTETEYTTTYTTEVTTGYWVTYTVTYTVPTTYSVDEENSSSDVTVELNNGVPTVTGIKDGATVTLKGSDDKEYPVTKETDGKYYVTIGGVQYEVVPTVTKDETENGKYNVSWSFAAGEDISDAKYEDGKEQVDKNNMPEGVQIKNNVITLTPNSTVTLGDKTFSVDENGNAYIMVDGEKCEVTLTATGDDTNGYTLSWSYEVTTTPSGGAETPKLPENVTAEVVDGKLTIKDGTGKVLATETTIEGHAITSYAVTEDGKAKVTCTDVDGSVYIYVINATELTSDGTGYEITYQQVSSVTTTEINEKGAENARKDLGGTDGSYKEFIAIALPDGTYAKVGQGDANNDAWLTKGEATNVKVTFEGNKIMISYETQTSGGNKGPGGGHGSSSTQIVIKEYVFEDLKGYDITNIVYNTKSAEHSSDGKFDHIIVSIAGIVVKDVETGEMKTLTLTANDNGELEPQKKTETGSIGTGVGDDEKLGGKTEQPKYVYVSSLTGSAVVVVKTEGGNQVEMTYSEYLEATAQGKDLELVGVYSSTIEPDDTEGPTDPSDPVIPVIPDPVDPAPVVVDEPDIPLAEEPEVEIDESDVPLNDLPEEIEIEEPEIPLAEEAEIELDDPALPLSDIPKTGDISGLWYAAAAVSASGLAATFALKKREDQEDQES